VGARTDFQALVPTISRSYRLSGARTDNQSLVPTISRSYRLSGDRTFFLVNLKKQEKFLTKMQVSVESAV